MGFSPVRLFLSAFFLLSGTVVAQVHVTLTAPELVNVGGALKDLVSQQEIHDLVAGPLGQFEAEIAGQVAGGLAKPGLYAGLAASASLPLSVWARPPWETPRLSFVLGTSLAVESDSFDPAVLTDRLRTLRPEVDYRVGASAHPLVAAVSWNPVPGSPWGAGVFGSLSSVSVGRVLLEARAAGASVHFHQGAPGARWGFLAWEGWTVSAGGGWGSNRYDTAVSLTLPTRTVPLDLTYLDAGEVVITGAPRFQVSLLNQGLFFPVQVSGGVSLGRAFLLGASAGAQVSWGSSSLGLRGRNPLYLQSATGAGLYEKFLGDTAWVELDGTFGGTEGPTVQGFATVTPSWAAGPFRLGLPLTWRYPGGLSATLLWGAVL